MGFTIVIVALLSMLIPLGFLAERIFSKQRIPQKLLLATSVVTGIWGGILTADLLSGAVVATGICAVMLVAQRFYNRRFARVGREE